MMDASLPTPSRPPHRPGVAVDGLSKSYRQEGRRVPALAGLSLAIAAGEFVAVVGTSGCGKSTLLRILAGLETDYEGRVAVDGVAVAGPGLDRGVVFQEHRLFPWLTVEENVGFGLAAHEPRERRRAVDEHLELVGLRGFERAFPHQLSGGMSQRVAIARALVNRPRVLLMDEPFGALDAFTRMGLQDELLRVWAAERTTVVLVTHDIDEAVFLADRVVVLSSRPGAIRAVVDVPLARPRDRVSPDFSRLRTSVYRALFPRPDAPGDFVL